MRHSRLLGIFFLVLLAIPSRTHADVRSEIFTKDNRSELCPEAAEHVNEASLAIKLLEFAEISLFSVNRVSVPPSFHSPEQAQIGTLGRVALYLVSFHARDTREPISAPDEASIRVALGDKAQKRLQAALGSFGDFLAAGGRSKLGYKVELRFDNVRDPLARDMFPSEGMKKFNSGLAVINCGPLTNSSNDEGIIDAVIAQAVFGDLASRFRLRGKVEDLRISRAQRDKFRSASSASVSFTDNQASGVETFKTQFVTGVAFGGPGQGYSVIPYAHYQNSITAKRNAPTNQVEVLATGMLFERLFRVGNTAWDIGLYPTATFDLQQNSEIVRLRAFVEPSFALGNDDYPLFIGGIYAPDPLLGLFYYRPDIKLIAEFGHILDRGSSPDFGPKDEYSGIGGEVSLDVRLNVDLLSRLTGKVTYRYMELFSVAQDQMERLAFDLSLALDEEGKYAIKWEYVDGENVETLQTEKFWGISFSAKF